MNTADDEYKNYLQDIGQYVPERALKAKARRDQYAKNDPDRLFDDGRVLGLMK